MVSVIVTPFETVELSEKTDSVLNDLTGSFYDKRTRRGKAVERLSRAVSILSEEAWALGISVDEVLK